MNSIVLYFVVGVNYLFVVDFLFNYKVRVDVVDKVSLFSFGREDWSIINDGENLVILVIFFSCIYKVFLLVVFILERFFREYIYYVFFAFGD